MKTRFIIPIAAFLLVTTLASLAPAQPTDTETPISVYVIWEASASAGSHWPNFHSICRQTCSSLLPGDRIEVISAHAGQPKLRVSQFIKSGDSYELGSIYTLLQRIRCPMLFDAHVEKAVDMAVKRIKAHSAPDQAGPVILIVLTSGKLNSREVGVIRRAGELFNKNGWKLCVTGTALSDRALLIAANQDLLEWTLIEQADPAAYIKQLRNSSRIAESKDTAALESPEEEHITKPKAPGAPLYGSRAADPGRPGPLAEDRKVKAGESGLTTRFSWEFSQSAVPRGVIDINLPKLPAEQETAARAVPEPNTARLVPSKDDPANAFAEDQEEVTIAEPNTPARKEKPARARKSLWALVKSFVTDRWLWLVAGGLAIPLAFLASFIAEDGRRAKKRREQAKAVRKNNRSQTDGIVIVKVNDQTHHLGKRNQLPVIHIGSGKRNGVRVFDRGVSDRHVRLYRKGSDLMVQNVGAAPIRVNNLPLPPKARQRLLLPTIVELTENTKLHFSLLRPKESAPAGKETNHEHAKELQSAH